MLVEVVEDRMLVNLLAIMNKDSQTSQPHITSYHQLYVIITVNTAPYVHLAFLFDFIILFHLRQYYILFYSHLSILLYKVLYCFYFCPYI